MNVGASVQRETISTAGTTSNPVLTASDPDDDAQLTKVILAAREDKLVTKDNIAGQLTDYAKASDLSAKADANDVYSKTDAENTFATKTELGSYATRTELDAKANTDLSNLTADGETKIKNIMSADMENKANKDTVTALGERVGGVEGKVTALENTVGNDSRGLVKDVADLRNRGNDLNNALGNKADKSDLDEAKAKITNITHDATGTSVDGVTFNAGAVTGVTSINGTKIGMPEGGEYISQDGSIWGNMKKVDTQVEKNEKNIETNKNDITALNGKVGKVGTGTYLDSNKTFGENLGFLDAGLKKEVDDRKTAIGELAVDGTYNYIKHDKNVSYNLVELDKQAGTNAYNIQINKEAIAATDKRTKGITRETDGTTATTRIEDTVTVDNSGNVGGVKGLSAETITTGKADIGTLTVTGESSLKNTNVEGTLTAKGEAKFEKDVSMDQKLTVTGDTSLQKTDVNGTLTANGEAMFKKKVTMENELDVSDTDGDKNAKLSVKAGEGVKASATDGTTTGSLDVKADGIVSSVTDASGKGSTFKQRIDAIMMESKDVSIKAEGTLTNEAKDIVTNASNSITEKVGETNVTTKTTTSSKSEIQNADTITSVQQTENMVQSFVGKKDFSTTNVTTNFANASANMVTENGQTSTVLNNKDGLLIRNTANVNSFTTVDRTTTGAAREWTNIKGNEISTGKVEADYVKMGYADVMHDLGVRGNAKIDGKTTTGSLEVTGTSKLTGDVTMENNATVGKNLTVNGITTTKTLKVTENAEVDGTLKVAKKATFEDSVAIAKDLSVGGDVTAKSYKVGRNTYIDENGINANNQKITNVADGSISEGSKDAVNGGQLYNVKNDLEGKVNKVGANAAAMANLHPMEFDPDSKWNIAAAIGNYGSETAAALGAFYRPNDDVMVNLSTAFGTGENMVGGGVSVRLGKGGNKLSREESNALKTQVADLTARMDALLSVLNPNMSKDFPDVPENHWAYEAVSRLAGNDIVQGYPDGEFHGERTMTRYEMAEIIYNALSRGAEAEKELVEEFKPELQAMAASEKATAERAEG